jgi:hypothetical protein
MEFAPIDDGQIEAEMWVEVDLRNIMRALPKRAFQNRIQGVMDVEMVAIKAAVESLPPAPPTAGGGPEERPLEADTP